MAASMVRNSQQLLRNVPRLLCNQRRCLGDLRPKPWIPRQRRPIEAATGKLDWARPLLERQKQLQETEQEEVEAPEPHKLHAVKRLKRKLTGVPKKLRHIMKHIGLEECQCEPHEFIIMKNTESNNIMLRKIKHLIKIVPITFPYGLPKDPSDYPHTLLKENGEFIVKPRVEGIILEKQYEEWKLTPHTKKKYLQAILDHSQYLYEFHPAKYVYRRNQDGKEYRYRMNKESQS